MKKTIIKILLFVSLLLITLVSLSGIDEMRDRESGMPPQYNNGNGNGNGNGGGNGNNPNVPIDQGVIYFTALVALYAIYRIRKIKK